MVVVSGPAGATKPLKPSGRANHEIVRDRIARRIVKVVRPLVDFTGPGLDLA
jgi:hypothetical protein